MDLTIDTSANLAIDKTLEILLAPYILKHISQLGSPNHS